MSERADKRGRKVLRIEPEVREIARKYLEDQLATMREFGSEPVLTPDQYEEILYRCAEPVQVIRNYNARERQKHERTRTDNHGTAEG